MTNELRRRLEVLNEKIDRKEKVNIVDKYTNQLVNSGYSRRQIYEIITSALKGYNRKESERKLKGISKFRTAASTREKRNRKKLLEQITWFRNNKKGEKENGGKEAIKRREKERKWRHPQEKPTDNPQAVLFVPYTHDSKLAKIIRGIIQDLKPHTMINLKVVERAGRKIVDSIHRSNPWENSICERPDCFPCKSSRKEMKGIMKNCKKRNVLYEIWCHTCLAELKSKLEKDKGKPNDTGAKEEGASKKRKRKDWKEDNEKEQERKLKLEKEIYDKTYKYIGETSRSASERGAEHLKDLLDYDTGSHMLKHIVRNHVENPSKVEFRMRILGSHTSAFNRQIAEAVMINRNKGPYLLNSKMEYNRSSLPMIKTSDKKSPWDLTQIEDSEMKEAIKLIRSNGGVEGCRMFAEDVESILEIEANENPPDVLPDPEVEITIENDSDRNVPPVVLCEDELVGGDQSLSHGENEKSRDKLSVSVPSSFDSSSSENEKSRDQGHGENVDCCQDQTLKLGETGLGLNTALKTTSDSKSLSMKDNSMLLKKKMCNRWP